MNLNTRNQDIRRLYKELAWTWPIISPPEDYIDESNHAAELIKKNARREIRSILNLGCGGGHNDFTLKNHFEVTGVDISSSMLELARKLNPEVTYIEGDMRAIRLEKKFDAAVIFDSLAYMLTEQDLRGAFETAYLHLKDGGVFFTYQENIPERFKQNYISYSNHKNDDIEIMFIENYYDPDPEDSTIEATFIYLIRRMGLLEVETDRHLCGIFPTSTWTRLLRDVGFEYSIKPEKTLENLPEFICLK